MIISIEKLKQFIKTDEPDAVLEAKLQALENLVRRYTNNNFQVKAYRSRCNIVGGMIVCESIVPFEIGDTVQISESDYNAGLYTIKSIDNASIELNEHTVDENNVLVTKVSYPDDVQMGIVNMIKWDLDNRAKVGIQSETISRHSVTYFNMDGDNSSMGYPKSLLGFLKPYIKARF